MGINQLREWRRVERMRSKYRKLFKPVFQKALDAQIKPFLNDIKFIDPNNTTFQDVLVDNSQIEKAYLKLYKEVGLEFSQTERDRFLKSRPNKIQIKADAFSESQFILDLQQYLSSGLVGQNIVTIGDTSKEHLQKLLNEIIKEVQEQGLGTSAAQTMLRDKLVGQWHADMRHRTDRIVRTEVSSASNWGQFKGVQSTGIPFDKFWTASFDERTRKAHFDANGQKKNINEPFIVGGEKMMYPLDSSLGASAGNIINCRCVTTYSVKDI